LSDVIERLRQLQAEMSKLADKDRALTTKPESFAEIDQRFETTRSEIDTLQQRIDELSRQRRDVESDLAAEQEVLKKFQGQLMQVKNQQQYAAAWKEIDTARKKIKEMEDEALKRMTEIEEAEQQLRTANETFEPLSSEHKAAFDEWQGSLSGLRDEVAQIKKQVSMIEAGLPPAIQREFHAMLKQRQGLAVAAVLEGSCGACRVRIRPQVVQQMKRGEVVRCESCRRYLVP
jgi:predicted  nucleic acid-binding Zn-ribbon protein